MHNEAIKDRALATGSDRGYKGQTTLAARPTAICNLEER